MDPFTVALAVFGVQKLRGQSTSKSFRDALLAATGAQALSATAVGADMGIKGFSFGADSMLSNLGPAATAQNSLTYGMTQAGGAPLTLAQQFQTTLPGQGISALMGDPYSVTSTGETTNKIFTPGTLFGTPEVVNQKTGEIITKGTGYRGLGAAEKLGLGFGTSSLLGNFFNKQPKDTSKGFTEQEYKDAYARQPDINLERTQKSTYYPATKVYDYQSPLYGFNKGGIVNALPKYAVGGVNYLPSKIDHDENDINNYVRASGYVEDGTGSGDKDEDTILAQLADGEFVSRTDAVLGAGIMAGASPSSMKEMRQKGAAYFYEQQARFKRIFDLLDASRKVN
jgi:hypothetical protein